jgi:glycopeptide antibiotics resistance protein
MNLQNYWRNDKKDNNSANKLTIVLFVIYLIALFWILLFKLGVRFSYMENRSVNLIPFSEFLILNGKIDFGELIMNVIIFVPFGIYAGVLFKRRMFGKSLFFFFLLSLIIEGLQFIFRLGAFDITDIITNTLGGVIGLMIFKAIEKVFKNSVKAQKFINITASIGTVLMILFLLLLKTNNLWIKYQ